MILVNIRKSGGSAATDDQVRAVAAGDWANISDRALELYGDSLAAVRNNVVVGVWNIEAHQRLEDGRVRFSLGDVASARDLVGQAPPTVWRKGSANPVKYVDSTTLAPEAAEVELTPQGNRRVALDGWSLIVYEGGRARLQAPDSDAKLMVEAAFPGPKGGNVTVRLVSD